MDVDPRLQASVEKELLNAEKFYDNLQQCAPWRYAAIMNNSRFCRESLEKAFALNGHTGRWFVDAWTYIVTALPVFIPATFILIPSIFVGLAKLISKMLEYEVLVPKTVQQTIEVPFLWFWKTKKTIEVTIYEPTIQPPDPLISQGAALILILLALFLSSWLLKWIFSIELRYRMRLVKGAVAHTERVRSAETAP